MANHSEFPAQTLNTLTDKDLARVSELIYRRAGIVLNGQKKDMVYNRLSRRITQLGINSFSEYMALLESSSDAPEWQTFVNSLTTNLTSFFREAYHFPILAEHARSRRGMYNVWCAAASTGEEPLSIAMTLEETLGRSITGPRILATDIDTDVLRHAKKGIYQLSDLASLNEKQKKNWFLRGTGNHGDKVKVKRELLASIHYQQLNLVAPQWDIPAPFDAIFCRNVMIYFDRNTQDILMRRFAEILKPGGILFAGHSEHFNTANSHFRLRGQSVYCLAKG
ncbi:MULTISPECIES: CheR family methyltransferase [unclassified Escherichia]|uniref:CheR family methyltransferase n=1 Tax=unclassified Escherichia TaxID=2608889 RepID=UPI001028EAD9|nr:MULTISPECIES: CheR family methyltransferase [unclassified Escherichia]RZM85177.1 chemotaxis protein-glutamate O-methyltransferase [Escherichia sp. E1V33]TBR64581.1 chemotaxis protein-glutamate O-methyltransferase [Escherichia sp. E10V4]TBR65053.1 chemotaxis protein-glutamate O-methyltransferase [Escherichia sp. E1S7]TGC03740.1 chemotaxis protein-glutamate O-methyltransferase [Escherichia sp. E2586]TGC12678.1 chemotaxis protein-glutamate O-methyltransferase [Escherichia sp. E2562]